MLDTSIKLQTLQASTENHNLMTNHQRRPKMQRSKIIPITSERPIKDDVFACRKLKIQNFHWKQVSLMTNCRLKSGRTLKQ